MLSWAAQFGWIAAGSAALMFLLWLVQRRTRDAGVVDVGWAASLGAAAVLCGLTGEGDVVRRLVIGAMGGVWGFRLAWHLLTDRVLRGEEDGRYQTLREAIGEKRIDGFFLFFFQAQAVTVVVLSLPFVLASRDAGAPGVWVWLGLGVWAVGLAGETIADAQLKRFKDDPANRGKVCKRGLWRYSRHPNYFFEWVMWVGYALVATGAPWGWLAWLSPALILLFVLKITGIPPTEKRSVRSRGEAYRQYQRETSAFFPWFPRSGADGAGGASEASA